MSSTFQIEVLKTLGYRFSEPKVCLKSPIQVDDSLNRFRSDINKSGTLGEFELAKPLKIGNAQWGSHFMTDGFHGLLLGSKSAQNIPAWLAGISFSFFKDSPLIVQIQAFKQFGETSQQTKELLKGSHWERLLVCLVGEWAQEMNFPVLYLQPAEANKWVRWGNMPLERAKMRYDVTAERLGFRRCRSGVYALALRD